MIEPGKICVTKEPDGSVNAFLPAFIADPTDYDLKDVRNHLDALDIMSYGLVLLDMFKRMPDLLSVAISNSDDKSDNGRTLSMEPFAVKGEEPAESFEGHVADITDYLNHRKHRGMYDFLDALFEQNIRLKRDTCSQRIGQAFDGVFENPGQWAGMIAARDQYLLDTNTHPSKSVRPDKNPRL
jgi:hypothetical protein